MAILDKDSLVNYLYRVYDLEKTIYQQKEIIHDLDGQVSKINNTLRVLPVYTGVDIQIRNKKVCFVNLILSVLLLIFSAIVCSKIGIMIIKMVCEITDSKELYEDVIVWYHYGVFKWAFIIMLIILGIFIVKQLLDIKSYNDFIEEASNDNEYKKDNWQKQQKYLNTQCQILVPQLISVQEELKKTQQALDMFYSVDVVYPKYRNMKAIYSFLEYICSGRCSELQGHEGAYNLYEEDLKFDRIIDRLDIISEQIVGISDDLSIIQNNQRNQYEAVLEINKKQDKIIQQEYNNGRMLQNIQVNSSLSLYNENRSRQRLESIEWIERQKYVFGK